MTSMKKRSPLWKFFDICENDSKFAQCLLCKSRISRGGEGKKAGTSAMNNHIKLKHSEQFAEIGQRETRLAAKDPELEEEDSRTSGKRAPTPTALTFQAKKAKQDRPVVHKPIGLSTTAARPEHSHEPCASCAISNYLRRRDEAEIIAKGWAMELEKMDEMQQLFAKKAINDIIMEGRLGNLHKDAVQIATSAARQPTLAAAWFETEQEDDEYDAEVSESEMDVKPSTMASDDPMPGTSTSTDT